MRPTCLLITILFALCTTAQCCCADHIVEVHSEQRVHGEGRWYFTASLTEGAGLHASVDSVRGDPRTIRLRVPTECGIGPITWTLRSERTAHVMSIRLYHLPGDANLPTIRLPFTGGRNFHFDMGDILTCVLHAGPRHGKYWSHELICRTGRVRHTFDEGRYVRFEPIDLEPWTQEPRPVNAYTSTQEARFLDGESGMQLYLANEVPKALIEPLPAAFTFTGNALVETNGTVSEVLLNGTPHPGIEAAIRTALQRSARWQPAVVERPSFPEGPKNFLAVRQPVPIRFVADPKAIWREFDPFNVSLFHEAPTSTDSLRIYFQWYAGSCGVYRDTVSVAPPTLRPWTAIAVGIGIIGEDCTDIAINKRTIVLPPLTPGEYRVHFGEAPAGTRAIRRADPYTCLSFTVH